MKGFVQISFVFLSFWALCIISTWAFTGIYAFLGEDCNGKKIILKKDDESLACLYQIISLQTTHPLTLTKCIHLENLHCENYSNAKKQFIQERMRRTILEAKMDLSDKEGIENRIFNHRETIKLIFITLLGLIGMFYMLFNPKFQLVLEEHKKPVLYVGVINFIGITLLYLLLVFIVSTFPQMDTFTLGVGIFLFCLYLSYNQGRNLLKNDGVHTPKMPDESL